MGAPNIDRIAQRPSPDRQRTLADFKEQGWGLAKWCQRCGHSEMVDVDWLIERFGSGFFPWNRWTRCEKLGCSGRAHLKAAKPPLVKRFYRLQTRIEIAAPAISLEELDAMIEAHRAPFAVTLTAIDWYATMGDPRAASHQVRTEGEGYIYRGLRVWIVGAGPSRVIDAEEAVRSGVG